MAKPTMKEVIKESYVPERLFRAAVRQFGAWEEFIESAQDIARYGTGIGWGGFIYYSETMPFTQKYKNEIIDLTYYHARDFGTDQVEFVMGMNGIRDSVAREEFVLWMANRPIDEDAKTIIENTLAWYTLETVAQDVCYYIYKED